MKIVQRIKLGFLLGTVCLLVAGVCFATGYPDKITIDSIQQYYEPVEFDHEFHVSMLNDCSTCHHHTTGTGTTDNNCIRCHKHSPEQSNVSCQGCHEADPFTPEALLKQRDQSPPVYHRDTPGLKAAYHQSCMGCHQAMSGPTGCQDCHSRNDSGDAIFKAGKYAPKPDPVKKK